MSGKLNIGDIVTRGCTVEELLDNPEWFYGPKFLAYPKEEWPVKQGTSVCQIPELKVTALNISEGPKEVDSLVKRIDFQRFSD